jgi:hypothetical protein
MHSTVIRNQNEDSLSRGDTKTNENWMRWKKSIVVKTTTGDSSQSTVEEHYSISTTKRLSPSSPPLPSTHKGNKPMSPEPRKRSSTDRHHSTDRRKESRLSGDGI